MGYIPRTPMYRRLSKGLLWILKQKVFRSSWDGISSVYHLQIEDYVFCEQITIYSSSEDRRPLTDFLCMEDLPQAFCEFINRCSSWDEIRPSVDRRPSTGFQWFENPPQTFNGSYLNKRASAGLLLIQDLPQVFYGQNTLSMKDLSQGSMDGRHSTGILCMEDLQLLWIDCPQVLCRWKSFYKSPKNRRLSTGPLWTGDLLKIFYGQKTFHRFSVDKRPTTVLRLTSRLWIEGLTQVFLE